ncbi:hypothetical protein INT47_000983 [Mucor saturninus]|uniref:Uncharacterized protein n=1 Tax=Mucor saturninus TaxID=64648 RepID=A0A8H7RNS9_9FUNG|nr:hypothetical protein INT47_000983 [Mucor saturninus]
MFSKSKRFPEAGKDYIPGPGEYDLSIEDRNRHKRFGFLSHTNRFPDGSVEGSESSEFDVSALVEGSNASMSSDTRVSCTSSNDDSTTPSPTRKKLPNPIETSNSQFEKYRYTMQKEIDALQMKSRKMESNIQSLELEKNDIKSTLISKDLELADLRAKNATLQKTLNRPSKAVQLQKKIDMLEESLNSNKVQHEIELQEKNQTIENYRTEADRGVSVIANFEKEHEALEAQISALSAQLSESKNSATKNELQINLLQQELNRIQNINTTLMQELETSKNETQDLKTVNNELMTLSEEQKEHIKQLESRALLKDQEIVTLRSTVEEKSTLYEKVQSQFKAYRHWIDKTVIVYLRSQRKSVQEHHYTELNALLTELHDAKKFMNQQAQYLDGLKSDVHWLTVQNKQLNDALVNTSKDRTEQYNIHNKKTIEHVDVSDTISYSSRSTISDRSTPLDSNLIVLNDSGFGLLIDEAK